MNSIKFIRGLMSLGVIASCACGDAPNESQSTATESLSAQSTSHANRMQVGPIFGSFAEGMASLLPAQPQPPRSGPFFTTAGVFMNPDPTMIRCSWLKAQGRAEGQSKFQGCTLEKVDAVPSGIKVVSLADLFATSMQAADGGVLE